MYEQDIDNDFLLLTLSRHNYFLYSQALKQELMRDNDNPQM